MCYICRQYGHIAKDCRIDFKNDIKKDRWIKVKDENGFVRMINKSDKKRRNRARKNKRARFTREFNFGKKIGAQPVDILMEDIKKAIWKYLQRFDLVQKVNKLDAENKQLREELFWYKLGEKRNHDLVSKTEVKQEIKFTRKQNEKSNNENNGFNRNANENDLTVENIIKREEQPMKIVESMDDINAKLPEFLKKFEKKKEEPRVLDESIIENDETVEEIQQNYCPKINEENIKEKMENNVNNVARKSNEKTLASNCEIPVKSGNSVNSNELPVTRKSVMEQEGDFRNYEEDSRSIAISITKSNYENEEQKIDNSDHQSFGSGELEASGASLDMNRMNSIREKCIKWVEQNRPKHEDKQLTQEEVIQYMLLWEKETSEYFTKALDVAVSKEEAEYYRKHEQEFMEQEQEDMLVEFC
jgi:hypothetical protein